MPSEKANDDGALAKQVGGIHVDMILIEQGEFRSAISDFEGSILDARGFELSFRLPAYLAHHLTAGSSPAGSEPGTEYGALTGARAGTNGGAGNRAACLSL
jgi:hypothetical protein